MNWIKKLFSNKTKKDRKTNDYESENTFSTQQAPKEQPQQMEIQMRMKYEYPKGQFRFPLIKDRPSEQPPRVKSGRRRVSEDIPEEIYDIEKEQKTPPKRQAAPIRTQPFEPTKIPSPIYGFNRPKQEEELINGLPKVDEKVRDEAEGRLVIHNQNEADNEKFKGEQKVVESEAMISKNDREEPLTLYSHEEAASALGMIDEENDPPIADEKAYDKAEGPLIVHNQEEVDYEEIMNEGEAAILKNDEEEPLTLDSPEETVSVLGMIDEENDPPIADEKAYDEANGHLIVHSQEETDNEEFFDEQMMIEDEAAVSQNNEEDLLTLYSYEETASALGMISEENDPPAGNEKTYDETNSHLIVYDQEKANNEELVNEQITIEDEAAFSKNDGEELLILSSHEETASAVEMIGEEVEAKEVEMIPTAGSQVQEKEKQENEPRSHLPFNVIMLKQDREKWQQQKQKEAEQRGVLQQETKEMPMQDTKRIEHYEFPHVDLLKPPVEKEDNQEWLDEQAELLNETLENFNVNARVVHVSQGPSVTRFEVQPERGVKVSKITNLNDDIKLSMAAKDIRIEAPIPGKRSVGIELPNQSSRPVQISEIIGTPTFQQQESPLTAVLGLDISGAPIVTDVRKMPHGLIAGATGSGKSVCINSILVSLPYKARPDELKLLLIDPKMVELAPYNHIPHLVSPVITDVKAATAALKWTVDEMERRYELFVHTSVRDINRFNELAIENGNYSDKLPYIIVVIDELADLMMMAPADVEESICRIAQKARACGIHLLIATQRPSVDVITGLIKANVPTRIAFSVSSQVDSRTIIDIGGAEKLLGRGDMLFLESGSSKPVRLQGTFVSDEEIDDVIEYVRSQGEPNYLFEQEELLKKAQVQEDEDELFMESCEFVVKQGSASTSLLQRQFRVGYNRAARLIQMMEDRGIISEARGSKPRDVLINESGLEQLKES